MTRLFVGERYERGGGLWEIAEVRRMGDATWVRLRAVSDLPDAGDVSVLVRAVNVERRFGPAL